MRLFLFLQHFIEVLQEDGIIFLGTDGYILILHSCYQSGKP